MTLSYALKETEAIIQRLVDLEDLSKQHPLDDEETNSDLQRSVSISIGALGEFATPRFRYGQLSHG